MKILVTGAKGFVGKNLISQLRNLNFDEIFEYDIDTKEELLNQYCSQCDFVFHLAGVNRPQNNDEFMKGNFSFSETLINCLKKAGNKAPVVVSSSIQAALDNPYGKSKKCGEDLFFDYANSSGVQVYIYRLPNVFGKWCKPNYNSAVATFCHNIARGLPVTVNDENVILNLVYIDDVIAEFINLLKGNVATKGDFFKVPATYTVKLKEIVSLLYSFKDSRNTLGIPNVGDDFTKKLYSTYLSYLPTEEFSYPLKMNVDNRGSFTEIFKTADKGQISVNISKPGITKGNHWHHTKVEKFVVVQGKALIRFRNIHSDEIVEYHVSGDKIEVVDIPVGYTHSIINEGEEDLVTVMWANETFDPDRPDTFFLTI